MKKHKFILTGLFAALVANSARASEESQSVQVREVEEARLEAAAQLLEHLSKTGALEFDSEGNVRVKPSILDQLRVRGRMEVQTASFSSVCT